MNHRSPVTVVIAGLVAAALAGCSGGAKAADAGGRTMAGKESAPAQAVPSAPDPRSIHVPTGAPAPVTSAAGEPLPTGPSLSLSPEDLWRRTVAAMAAQTSASLTIDFRDDQGRPVHTESSVASNGDCVGRITAGGGQAQVIHVGQTPYLKGDPAFWAWATQRGDVAVSTYMVTHWNKGALAQLGYYGVEAMCSLSVATGNTDADFGGTKKEGRPSTVGGRPVVALTQTGSAGSVTLDVVTTGPAVVVKAVQSGGGSPTTTTTFANLGKPVHPKAPAGAFE